MRIHFLALLAVALLGVGTARANDFQFTSYEQIGATLQQQKAEIGELRAELISMKSELADGGAAPAGGCTNGCCGDSCCNSCCDSGCCDDCCIIDSLAYDATCGWYAYAEALLFRPFHSQGVRVPANGNGIADFGYSISPRLTLGWTGDCDFGLRVRYWQFDARGLLVGTVNGDLKTYVGDIEATDRICLGKWIATGAAGVRILQFRDRNIANAQSTAPAPGTVLNRNAFDGVGITTALDLIRPISCHWSFYANGRYSILMGTANITGFGGIDGAYRYSIRSIGELGAGLQYNNCLRNGMNFFARGGFEAQYWSGFGISRDQFGVPGEAAHGGAAFGFAGLTGGAGINF